MIEPTVGRVVWYWDRQGYRGQQPQAALVAFVHNVRLVNLLVIDAAGNSSSMQEVALVQPEELQSGKPPLHAYCEWMPYQKGQAAKTEQLVDDIKTLHGAGVLSSRGV